MPPTDEKASFFWTLFTSFLKTLGVEPTMATSTAPETHELPPWNSSDMRDAVNWACFLIDRYPKMNRTAFGSRDRAEVCGWPSTGGMLVAYCDGVELEFLGLDHLKTAPRSSDAGEEDAHCAALRKLGAKWWPSQGAWHLMRFHFSIDDEWEEDFKIFGWPSSGNGVWSLRLGQGEAGSRGAGRIYNARTMDERCVWIERFGGSFYANPDDCPDLDLQRKLEGNVRMTRRRYLYCPRGDPDCRCEYVVTMDP